MSPFPTPEDHADAKTTAMFDAEPATDRQCSHCTKDMSRADVEAESSPQDGMCQSCRAFVHQCKEDSAMSNSTDINVPDANRVKALIGSFHKVDGAWRGTSYGYHPHGVVRRGIIFTDHHNVSGSHAASVILEPESGLIFPPNDAESSRCGSTGKACIRPKCGGTVEVYRNGQWVGPDGPWRKLICDILDELDLEVSALKEAEAAKIETQKQEIKRENDEQFRLAAAALNRQHA